MLIILKNYKENHKEFIKNSKLIFRRDKHNAFTEGVIKIALSANYDKIMQSINLIETYANGTNKEKYTKKKKLNVAI